MRNNAWDGIAPVPLNLPYNKILPALDPEPRLVDGHDMYVTFGGSLAKRPGLRRIPNTTLDKRIDRLWWYETQENPSHVYLVASVYDSGTSTWSLRYNRVANGTGWLPMPDLRDINLSTRPHEVIQARGLLYIKSYPDPASSEKLGTVIFDGSDETVTFWGIEGPSVAARITGIGDSADVLIKITDDVDSAVTTFPVTDTTSLPTAPFKMRIGFEVVEVTGYSSSSLTVTRAQGGSSSSAHKASTPIYYLDWQESDNEITVGIGWTYFYCWKTKTGQYSNISPVEENPDLPPSITPPFRNLRPRIIVQGHADTDNVPHIIIFRTQDGGGNAFFLYEIDNTGAGDIEFEDRWLESGISGGVFNDPIPDIKLSALNLSPTQTSNSPPPTTLAPAVTGEDPVEPSSHISYYASRAWFSIGNVLFYSANEELQEGIPEESWPSGFGGNSFRFQSQIIQHEPTTDALYVQTINDVFWITGTNRETFNPNPIVQNVGAAADQPRSSVRFGNQVAFLTSDYRIGLLQGFVMGINRSQLLTLSNPLDRDIKDLIDAGGKVFMDYWCDMAKEWFVVTVAFPDDPSRSRVFVMDVAKSENGQKPFWFTPWRIPCTAAMAGRLCHATRERCLLFAMWNPDTEEAYIGRIDPTGTKATDDLANGQGAAFGGSATTNLFLIPVGNHVNALRQPGLIPNTYNLRLELTDFAGSQDPRLYAYDDDTWTQPKELSYLDEPPAGIWSTRGYRTLVYPRNRVTYRTAFKVDVPASKERFELQSFAIIWDPEHGGSM